MCLTGAVSRRYGDVRGDRAAPALGSAGGEESGRVLHVSARKEY